MQKRASKLRVFPPFLAKGCRTTQKGQAAALAYLLMKRPLSGWHEGWTEMLMTLFVLLLLLWFIGIISAYTLGGFIHLLLVLAVAMVLLRIVQGRRVV